MLPRGRTRRPARRPRSVPPAAAPRSPGWKAVPGSGPEREMAAGGVTTAHDALRVDRRDIGQMVDGEGDILERPGPPAVGLTHPSVLDVPCREPPGREIDGERRHQSPIPACAPEPAVDQHDARPRPAVPRGKMEIADLVGVRAVGDARRGRSLASRRHVVRRAARGAGRAPPARCRRPPRGCRGGMRRGACPRETTP